MIAQRIASTAAEYYVLREAEQVRRCGGRMTKVLYRLVRPIHNGHVRLIETAAYLFDTVVVATMRNPQKGEPLFDLDERKQMIEESLAHVDNVEVVSFAKLVVDVAKEIGADFIIKGLAPRSTSRARSPRPGEPERLGRAHPVPALRLCQLGGGIEVHPRHRRFGGDVSSMVLPAVAKRLLERYGP